MILTIGNTKGGVGKTTLAVSIAIAKAIIGRKVWLIDGDRQGTSRIAMLIRAQNKREPFIQCDQIHDGKDLIEQVQANAHKFDHVVIDVGGRDSTALRAALGLSHMVLIPFPPRALDVWAGSDIAVLVKEARSINPKLRAAAFLSCADTAGSDNQDAVDALKDLPELEYLDAPIMRRKSVANAVGQGLCVLESLPKDKKAIDELNHLVGSIFTL